MARETRYGALAAVTTALALGMTGCGAAAYGESAGIRAAGAPAPEMETSVVASAPPPAPPGALASNDALPPLASASGSGSVAGQVADAKSVSDAPHSGAMLVYTANLGMAVYQVDPGLDGVERVARDLGGYLSSRQDTSVTVRVPRDHFDDAIARIEKLGDVTHRDIKAQDVTDEFVDVQARLKNAYAMRDRLTDLLGRASAKDALDIEKELGRVTEEIERMEGRLKLLRDQIAFSTITVSFTPLAPQTVRDSSLLSPFPWLQDLGLGALLDVH